MPRLGDLAHVRKRIRGEIQVDAESGAQPSTVSSLRSRSRRVALGLGDRVREHPPAAVPLDDRAVDARANRLDAAPPSLGDARRTPGCRVLRATSQPWRDIRETACRTAASESPNGAMSRNQAADPERPSVT